MDASSRQARRGVHVQVEAVLGGVGRCPRRHRLGAVRRDRRGVANALPARRRLGCAPAEAADRGAAYGSPRNLAPASVAVPRTAPPSTSTTGAEFATGWASAAAGEAAPSPRAAVAAQHPAATRRVILVRGGCVACTVSTPLTVGLQVCRMHGRASARRSHPCTPLVAALVVPVQSAISPSRRSASRSRRSCVATTSAPGQSASAASSTSSDSMSSLLLRCAGRRDGTAAGAGGAGVWSWRLASSSCGYRCPWGRLRRQRTPTGRRNGPP